MRGGREPKELHKLHEAEVSHTMVAFVALDTQSGNMDPCSVPGAHGNQRPLRDVWNVDAIAVYSPCLLSS